MSKILLPLLVALGLTGAAAAQTGQIEIKDAWARATPAGAETGAAYLTIVSPTADRLTAAATPVANQAELHTMTMEGGVMKMRPLAGIDLPAGQPVTLKPGGTHLMLTGLKHPLKEGESVPLTLTFEKAGVRQVEAKVQKLGAMNPPAAQGANPLPPAGAATPGAPTPGAPTPGMANMPAHH